MIRRSPASLREAKARGEKLTAPDGVRLSHGPSAWTNPAWTSSWVGDSLGMVVLGYPDTTAVTVEDIVHHTRAAARGVQHALLVADLPAHSYETPGAALENGRRLMEAGAQAVKLEGGATKRAQIAALAAADIPVMGHIGMLPQSVHEEGGYKIKGRSEAEIDALLEDGRSVEAAARLPWCSRLSRPRPPGGSRRPWAFRRSALVREMVATGKSW